MQFLTKQHSLWPPSIAQIENRQQTVQGSHLTLGQSNFSRTLQFKTQSRFLIVPQQQRLVAVSKEF